MLSACFGAKRGASSIHTVPEGSVIASTSFGSGRRQALAGASLTMSAVVRACGADAAVSPAGAEACACTCAHAAQASAATAKRRVGKRRGTGFLGGGQEAPCAATHAA